ncbi:MAG: NADH-quinone oxidoreductase subunit M, partial [Candidatus Omnitrophica bacterium]|nr:NADH-quinone oxidoreductase subunit M [Candidatus Omnitrophota bacterium]
MNLLTSTFWVSLAGALVLLFLKKEDHHAIRRTAALAGFICLSLTLATYVRYDLSLGGMQFVLKRSWIPEFGIDFHVGVDGISLPLILLTGFIFFTGVLIAWNIEDRPKEFFILFLTLVAGVFGVFVSLNLFLLFIFYELAVLPMYLLIGVWGSTRKEYGAMKLTLYLLVGSALIFIGMLALYFESGIQSFDLTKLSEVDFPMPFQKIVFPLIFIGFGVLGGLWPLHTWSPVGHVAAPTSVSMLHAGVLMKLGAYGCFRVAMVLLPEGAAFWLPWIAMLATVNIVYGSMIAMVQRDFKFVIGYSSVSHMGFVLLGLASMDPVGVSGAVLQMFSHGIMTGLFFAIVGRMVYDRT